MKNLGKILLLASSLLLLDTNSSAKEFYLTQGKIEASRFEYTRPKEETPTMDYDAIPAPFQIQNQIRTQNTSQPIGSSSNTTPIENTPSPAIRRKEENEFLSKKGYQDPYNPKCQKGGQFKHLR